MAEQSSSSSGGQATATATTAEMQSLYESLKNWGRWGDDDERGALNHLTDEHRASAAGLVVDGTAVSLAQNLPVIPSPDNPFPAHHHMLAAGDDGRHNSGIAGYEASRDYVGIPVHGLAVTHIDALCHMFVQGQMYNGAPATDVVSDGARRNSVMVLADGVVGRGVLLDIAALRGVDYLPGNTMVTVEDLEAAETAAGVQVGTGDILLVSTGRDAWRAEKKGQLSPAEGMAGLHYSCLPWLNERGVAVLGSDGISDPTPGLGIPDWPFPIHQIGITGLGLHLIDNMSLGPIGVACAARNRYAFLFSVAPLRVVGGTGCPVNPTAVL